MITTGRSGAGRLMSCPPESGQLAGDGAEWPQPGSQLGEGLLAITGSQSGLSLMQVQAAWGGRPQSGVMGHGRARTFVIDRDNNLRHSVTSQMQGDIREWGESRVQCRECGAETPDRPHCIVCGAPAATRQSRPADAAAGTSAMPGGVGDAADLTVGTAEAPAWSPGRPAVTALAVGFGPDDEVSDVVPARRRGRLVQITIAAVSVLAVAVALVAVAVSAAHRHASISVRLMATLTASGSGYSVAFSPDGHTLATGGGGAYLWDVATRRRIATLTDAGGVAVAFSPDGHALAVGGGDGRTYVWDVATGHRIATLTDPGGVGILAVAFSPDGHTLATGDSNGSTYLWDVATGHRIATLRARGTYPVQSVAFSPDGRTLATGGGNGRTYLWYVR